MESNTWQHQYCHTILYSFLQLTIPERCLAPRRLLWVRVLISHIVGSFTGIAALVWLLGAGDSLATGDGQEKTARLGRSGAFISLYHAVGRLNRVTLLNLP
jgi:hypothetical protein